MKASIQKNAADPPPPSDDETAIAADEEEKQPEPEESGDHNNKEGEGKYEEEEEEEGEEEEDEEEEEEEGAEEAPKLEEGFYEIEEIKKKRVRKGQPQYLIKWRGWPESANTWEPLDNVQSCADIIEAFEEKCNKSSRKRKRKYGGPHQTARKKRSGPFPSAARPAEPLPRRNDNDNGNYDNAKDEMKVELPLALDKNISEENRRPTDEEEEEEEEEEETQVAAVDTVGCITIQLDSGSRDEEVSMEDGSSKIEGTQPLQGAKRRKAGCVRRFKQELPPKQDVDGGEKLGSEDVDSTEEDNGGDGHKLDDSANPPYITKILKPVRYCASITDDVQQVSITFKALMSDGTEVSVDDKDLKVNNPLLLISYYEQHLRYRPHI